MSVVDRDVTLQTRVDEPVSRCHHPITVDGKFFRRGDTRFDFRGVTYGTFRPRSSDAQQFPEASRVHEDLAAIERAGFTVVRTYVEPRGDVLESIGEHGLHTLAGIFWPDWRYLVGASGRQQREMASVARHTVRDAARRLVGRTEVLAICLGNEIPADVVRWVGATKVASLISELADEVRSVDADRLVTYANYPSTEYLRLDDLDFLTFNVFLERKADLRRYLTRLHTMAGERPLVVGELGLDATGGSTLAEHAQADAIEWQLDVALERGVAGTCVFSWTDEWWVGGADVDGWRFGLTRADRSPRPALAVAAHCNQRTAAALNPRSEWPSISIVICAYNAADTLDECLAHTCRLDYPGLEIIVVDDGSTDSTAAIVATHDRAQLVSINHGGLSVARNEGLRAASGQVVAYLDADAYPSPEWPYYLALGFDSRSIGGVGGPNVPPPSDPVGAARVAAAPGGPVHVLLADDRAEHIPGCNMAFWRSVLEEVGGFDPIYTAAGDDVDVCWKVLDKGWEIGFHPAALVWHHRRASGRAYLRQQRGYGRAEALVAARHPDRFNSIGAARWRGRIYGGGVSRLGRQRIYRGAFGSAPFQSIYRSGGTVSDVLHQVGVPTAALLLMSAPLALAFPHWWVAPIMGLVFAGSLGAHDAVRTTMPAKRPARPLIFRIGVAWLCLAQPLARRWGRLRAAPSARRDLPDLSPLAGPVRRLSHGIFVIPADGPRDVTTRSVVDVIRRAGFAVTTPTGWERRDVGVLVSRLIAADLLTTGHAAGLVQIQLRPRFRRTSATVAAILVAAAVASVSPRFGLAVAFLALVDATVGVWRTRVGVPRAVARATRGTT